MIHFARARPARQSIRPQGRRYDVDVSGSTGVVGWRAAVSALALLAAAGGIGLLFNVFDGLSLDTDGYDVIGGSGGDATNGGAGGGGTALYSFIGSVIVNGNYIKGGDGGSSSNDIGGSGPNDRTAHMG
jgi:hypothetical protein